MNTKLIRVTGILTRVCEVLVWFGTGCMVLAGLATLIFGKLVSNTIIENLNNGNITIDDLGLKYVGEITSINTVAVGIAFLIGAVATSLVAMIFRNITLIFKQERPFCDDNIRMVREIGIFAISLPVAQTLFSAILSIGFGPCYADVAVDGKTLIFGIIVLALSQYFRYGAELEKDVDGLL